MRKFIISATVLLSFYGVPTYANQDDFCAGFEEGYKSIKGDMVIVPMCPLAPITPIGQTDFREGIKAGIAAANSDGE